MRAHTAIGAITNTAITISSSSDKSSVVSGGFDDTDESDVSDGSFVDSDGSVDDSGGSETDGSSSVEESQNERADCYNA